MAILIIDKADFRMNRIIKDKQGHFIVSKSWIHQEDKTVLNLSALNNRDWKYMK